MLTLVTYDVNTETKDGQRRLRKVAKICTNCGQRVQNSVFECSVTPAMYLELKDKLTKIINPELDSIRFYRLGKNWQNRVETIGHNDTYDPDKGTLLI